MNTSASALPLAQRIHSVRGHKVMLDRDLAELYGVTTKALLQSVKRNPDRFPQDFMFLLTKQEIANLRSQIMTSSHTIAPGTLNSILKQSGLKK